MLSSSTASKKSYLGTAAASFVGIMAAVPITLALVGPDNKAGAVADEDNDYAKYAYAYTQGYMANAGASGTVATSGDGGSGAYVCTEPHDDYVGGREAGAVAVAHRAPVGGYGNAPDRGHWDNDRHDRGDRWDRGDRHDRRDERPRGGSGSHDAKKWTQEIKNSYNNYRTYTHNSSTVNNVNSNNVIGSHNETKTEIEVEDSKGVIIGVDNNTSTHNNMANDSFNRDSYNTHTETNTVLPTTRSIELRTLTIQPIHRL